MHLIFCKKYLCSENPSPEMIKSELVIFTTYIFFANKITTTGSSAFQKTTGSDHHLSIFEKKRLDQGQTS